LLAPTRLFWSFKDLACRQFIFSHPGRVISKFQFSALFSEAWSTNNIVSGFRCTGVCPFNPDAILDKLPEQDKKDSPLTTHSSDGEMTKDSTPAERTKDSTPAEMTPCDSQVTSIWLVRPA